MAKRKVSAAAAPVKTGTIEGIKAIEHTTFPIPERGGVVVFRGRNGSGKSVALDTINRMLGGKGDVAVNDNAQKGMAEGFGVTLSVGRSTRKTGEAEFQILEGRFSVADLVDPGFADPIAADRHRIKALIQLAGVESDPHVFDDLFADEAERRSLLSPETLVCDDLVVMASKIKRDIEARARVAEDQITNAKTSEASLRESVADINVNEESDSNVLQQRYGEARANHAALDAQLKAAAESKRLHEVNKDRMAKITAMYQGPTVADATQAWSEAERKAQSMRGALAVAEEQLRQAREAYNAAKVNLEAANEIAIQAQRMKNAAEAHQKTVDELNAGIEAPLAAPIDIEDLRQANAAVNAAYEAVERGALIRRAKDKLAEANRIKADIERMEKDAIELREKAARVDDVLSGLVGRATQALRVGSGKQAGRLVTGTKRGPTLFAELSEGEKWRIALDVAIDALGERGELTIPQPAWEGLDPSNRQAIRDHLTGTGVVAYTAECDDGDLRAELYA